MFIQAAIILGAYVFLLVSSGWFLERVIERVPDDPEGNDEGRDGSDVDPTERERDIGRIVGKAENILVLSFVFSDAYTALAVVFAAKSIVRREDMKNNSLYYLAGTLVNFTYSVVIGLLARSLLSIL